MKKQKNWKKCLMVALASYSLLSSNAHAIFGIEEATLPEQIIQSGFLKDSVFKLEQMLRRFGLGAQIETILGQMTDTNDRIERVVDIDTEFRDNEFSSMSPDEALKYQAKLKEDRAAIKEEIASIRNEILTSPDKFDGTQEALMMAEQADSPIKAEQASVIQAAAAEEQQWEQTALKVLELKEKEIDDLQEADQDRANAALRKCIEMEEGCG